ncbi:phosphoribosyl-ATP diphosphatase [Hydromonas duriensis]|uniref:Phosphoribosyl-ATP pyrophosphatase n=1 Tax=Hydromonas duriensis TaxID=1527608 RepID=A0A4R6Y7N9_9BURK|nr:phosphoribosyl-ATP diphosphatase [Hydromonas duriensis]TDR31374.1 phosphoribosyl-ATP pyrophosphatase [Hydromonas duriensis]
MQHQIESVLNELGLIIESRKGGNSESSYVARLFNKGEDTILKKVGEECTEVVIAAKGGHPYQIIYETADLLFHVMVMLSHYNLSLDDIARELARREGMSGLEEKASRNDSPLDGKSI